EIMRTAADDLKRVTLELGGKSPNIVFADSDLDSAVKGAITGIFYGKGECCNAGSRLFVEAKAHDAFMEKLVERAKKLRPGDPLDPKTRLGAIVSEQQMKQIVGCIETGKSAGAQLVTGGRRPVGGYKQSGSGRELGMHAIEHYTELKSIWMSL